MGDDHIGLEGVEVHRISLHLVRITGCKRKVTPKILALLPAPLLKRFADDDEISRKA